VLVPVHIVDLCFVAAKQQQTGGNTTMWKCRRCTHILIVMVLKLKV